MASVRSLAARPGAVSVRALMTELTGGTDSLRQAFGARSLQRAYARIGGYSSRLGMPIAGGDETRDTVTTVAGRGHLARFRSGTLVVAALDGPVEDLDGFEVSIDLVALECRDKQEVGDEVVGSVGWIRPSDKAAGVSTIPKLDMGAEGERIVQFSQTVYAGPFANINLCCSLVEKDSGDTTKYREAFAAELQKAAAVGATAAGLPSEATASDTGWMNTISIGLTNILFDLIGADDDPYNAQTFMINWREMKARNDGTLPEFVLKRDDDPHVVTYTHRQIVSGTDDGGDKGEYAFYFMVRTRPRPKVPIDF
jgi:hypothetical protein